MLITGDMQISCLVRKNAARTHSTHPILSLSVSNTQLSKALVLALQEHRCEQYTIETFTMCAELSVTKIRRWKSVEVCRKCWVWACLSLQRYSVIIKQTDTARQRGEKYLVKFIFSYLLVFVTFSGSAGLAFSFYFLW